jgi:4-hydroxy-tetrahydrodipicolinate reductase
MIKLAITGACGRMGRRIATLATEDDTFELTCALERQGHPDLGKNYSSILGSDKVNVNLSDTLSTTPDVMIDFTAPVATCHWIDVALGHNIPLVIGTTGLTDTELARVKEAAKTIPIVQAPNMSIGMNLLFRTVTQMTRALGEDYDIEIVEQHHRFKKDAPSGSALGLLNSVAEGRGKKPNDIAIFGREGREAERKPGEVAVHALRLGDTVGEHTVYFGALGETISIAHSAHSRDTFARGALRAAQWLIGRAPGHYSMQDVLFGNKE